MSITVMSGWSGSGTSTDPYGPKILVDYPALTSYTQNNQSNFPGGFLPCIVDGPAGALAATLADAKYNNVTVPSSVTAAAASPGIRLTLVVGGSGFKFNVYRATVSGQQLQAIATQVSGPFYTDTTTTPGVTYYYKSTAVNASGGEGPMSAETHAVAG